MNHDRETAAFLAGTHTSSIARLDPSGTHTISRAINRVSKRGSSVTDCIDEQRRKMAHSATALFCRIKEKLPDRNFTVTTGVLVATDNKLYVCAVIERTE